MYITYKPPAGNSVVALTDITTPVKPSTPTVAELQAQVTSLTLQLKAAQDEIASYKSAITSSKDVDTNTLLAVLSGRIDAGLATIARQEEANRDALTSILRATEAILDQSDNQFKCLYPSSLLLLPHRRPKSLRWRIESKYSSMFDCHIMCEFQSRVSAMDHMLLPMWHPVDGLCRVVKHPPTFVQKLGPQLKYVSMALMGTSKLGGMAGVSLPDLSGLFAEKGPVATVLGLTTDEHKLIDAIKKHETGHSHLRPSELEGPALAEIQKLFGPVLDGVLEPLHRCSVHSDGPYGHAGTVLWLCPAHTRLVAKWNDAELSPRDAIKAAVESTTTITWPV